MKKIRGSTDMFGSLGRRKGSHLPAEFDRTAGSRSMDAEDSERPSMIDGALSSGWQSCRIRMRLILRRDQLTFTTPGGFHDPSPGGRMEGASVFGQ